MKRIPGEAPVRGLTCRIPPPTVHSFFAAGSVHGEFGMNVSLIVTKGDDSGKIFRLLGTDEKIIGRSSRSSIILQDAGVSRQHCRIGVHDSGLMIEDLNSKNGTWVNGEAIRAKALLADGDMIQIGRTTLKVRIETAEESAIPSLHVAESAAEQSETSESGLQIQPLELDLEAFPGDGASGEEKPSRSEPGALMGAFEEYVEQPLSTASPEDEPVLELVEEGPSPSSPGPEAMIGRIIGGCRIDELVRQDEVTHVYRGQQLSMERAVALRILSPELTSDPEAADRFIAGARAAGKLNHPNIVQVFDAGEEEGIRFIALEHVDGESVRGLLERRGRKRPLDAYLSVEIIRQIAEALQYAHTRNLLHLNITPDNILVTPHNIAKLAEIGFLQSLKDSGIYRPSRTSEQSDALQFASPELLDPAAGPDERSDIYSLGAVLFLMLSGRLPFSAGDESELLKKIREGNHESLSAFNRSLPDRLIKIVNRAIAFRPEQRYQSAEELHDDLRGVRERLRH